MLTQPVLLFDGDCNFCRAWVARLERIDRNGVVRCLPSADRHVIEGLPQLDDEALDRAMHLVTPDGAVYVGARAVPALLPYLPRWRWLGVIFLVPGVTWVSDRVYSEIARRRHRLGCGSERCRIGR